MSNPKSSNETERKRHIEEMKEKLRRHLGGSEPLIGGNFKSLKDEEAFLEHILFMEGVDEQPLFDLLEKGGVALPEPDSMPDSELHDKLWEVIRAMALLGQYLVNTDHLSDRGLYEVLWNEILREPTSVSPDASNAYACIDLLGGCSDEDIQTRLRFYADEEERLSWQEEFPDEILPPHEPPPYDRDRHLPVPPAGYSPPRESC